MKYPFMIQMTHLSANYQSFLRELGENSAHVNSMLIWDRAFKNGLADWYIFRKVN